MSGVGNVEDETNEGRQPGKTDRHTDEQTDRLTDRQTDRPEIILRCGVLIISGQTDRKQTVRQT